MNNKILDKVNKYYTDKILIHGATPSGVDWNSIESQEIRFKQLLNVLNQDYDINNTFLDYGCGYGSLFQYLNKHNFKIDYIGYDISKEMINKAVQVNNHEEKWISELPDKLKVDYTVASGLFNVKQDQTNEEWENYILDTLIKINSLTKKAFAFNILTSYSDVEFMKDYLYYSDPAKLFDFCKRNFSRNVALLHDYNLYEFTIIIRK